MENKNVLLAFAAGIGAGALIGLLVAATEKDEMPGDDGFPADHIFGDLRDKYAGMLERLNQQLDAVKQEFEVMESRH